MLEMAIVSFTTFFATIGPIDVVAVFAALTTRASLKARRSMAVRGTIIAAVILLSFALVGKPLLAALGISLAALRVAGGILLFLIGIDMVFARSSGGTSTTDEEAREAARKQDISVFPLATPLIAGPGSMGAAILLMAEAEGDIILQLVVIGSLLGLLALLLIGLLLASQIQKFVGVTPMHVIGRVFGVLLAALAVQFVLDGIAQSGLLAP